MPSAAARAVVGAAALVAVSCSHADPVIAPRGPEVTALRFEGNRAASTGDLREAIVTEATAWWPFAEARRFDPFTWDNDVARVERYYRARGFHRVRVTGETTRQRPGKKKDDPGEVELRVRIEEGPRSVVRSLYLDGLSEVPAEDRRGLADGLPLMVGRAFTEADYAATKDALLARLRDRGYGEASLRGRALVHTDQAEVDVDVLVTPGPRYAFGDVRVEQGGARTIEDWRIEEQVRLEAPAGRTFSPERVREAQRRVYSLGVFSSADVETGAPDPATGRLPIEVRTQSAPYRTLRLGGGGRSDQVRDELRLLGTWTHENFLGDLRKLVVQARLGWAFLPGISQLFSESSAEVRNGPIYDARVELIQPRLFGQPLWRLVVSLGSERMLEEAFTSIAGRGGPSVVWQPSRKLSVSAGYTLDGSYLEALGALDPRVAPLVLGCKENPCFVLLSYLSQRVAWDGRDDFLAPTRGGYVSLELQEGGGPLGGEFTYLRALLEGRLIGSVGRFTLGGRGQIGLLFPQGGAPADSPISQRLFAGGGNSMRGFGNRRLSPMAAVEDDPGVPASAGNVPDATVPIGGNGLLVGSVELRYRLSETWSLAAFWDTGIVTADVPTANDLGDLFHAFGVGVRIHTPVGPIRIDVARRLAGGGPRPVDGAIRYPESTSCFGFGGSGQATPLDDGLCALHLSIGEAF